MNILLNRMPVQGPWGGGNLLVKAFCKYLPDYGHKVYHLLDSNTLIDVIFLQDPSHGNTGISINEAIVYKKFNPNVKIVQRINECDARKDTEGVDNMLLECSHYIDATIFVSHWMKNYHMEKGWACKKNIVIYNGVDLTHFKPSKKIKNNKINIVTHHWSDNILKGFDIYEALDKFVKDNNEFTFSYIGRHRNTFKNTNIVDPLFGEKLGLELSKYDVYISGSRYDPGPNHILESIACEIPTYVYKEGGGCIEFAGKDHVFKSFKDLKLLLLSKDFRQNSKSLLYDWRNCIYQVSNFLEKVCYEN